MLLRFGSASVRYGFSLRSRWLGSGSLGPRTVFVWFGYYTERHQLGSALLRFRFVSLCNEGEKHLRGSGAKDSARQSKIRDHFDAT